MLRRPSCARTGYTASQAATIAVHEPASPRAARAVTRVASSEHFDAQQRLVRPWVSGDVVNRQGAEGTRFEFWSVLREMTVQQLAAGKDDLRPRRHVRRSRTCTRAPEDRLAALRASDGGGNEGF